MKLLLTAPATHYDRMLAAMRAGDRESALVYWRAPGWTDKERARMRRLLATARDIAIEVLP